MKIGEKAKKKSICKRPLFGSEGVDWFLLGQLRFSNRFSSLIYARLG
jgi:hypothetical protein